MTDLKLLAVDAEDLEIISACVQDAVVRVGDMRFVPGDSRFALLANRFVWEKPAKRGQRGERHRAALRFDRVRASHVSGIDLNAQEGVLELLALKFEFSDAPSGIVTLVFAGGGAIRLDVECLEARLHDLGAAWATKAIPAHDLNDSR